jgi:hypothetical protein
VAELKDRQVIEDAFITKMLLNPAYTTTFPFLRPYAAALRTNQAGCGRCGRKAAAKAVDYTEIKRTLAAMPKDKQADLLRLTKARSVRLVYRNRAGAVVQLDILRDKPAA